MDFDSIYFLSSSKNNIFNSNRIRLKDSPFWTNYVKLDVCLKFLEETQKMKIVKNDDIQAFLIKYPNIYYDGWTQHDKKPKCDKLYTRINDRYFVDNDKYFEKFNIYYYTLFQLIFSKFGANVIKTDLNKNNTNKININVALEAAVASTSLDSKNVSIRNEHDNHYIEFPSENNFTEKISEFNKLCDYDKEIEYLNNLLPHNLRNTVFIIEPYYYLVTLRTQNKTKKLTRLLKLEKKDINQIQFSINEKYTGFNLGFSTNSNFETIKKDTVKFEISFHKIVEIEQDEPSEEQTLKTTIYKLSLDPISYGPWPINCTLFKEERSIKYLETAKEYAKKFIDEDPEKIIVEIAENFTFPFTWNYIVKSFKIKESIRADIKVGKGRRFVMFDSANFEYSNFISKRLLKEKYLS